MRTNEQLRERIAELGGFANMPENALVRYVDELEEDIEFDLKRFDLDDPEQRWRATEWFGLERYSIVMAERRRRCIIKRVAGHDLLRVNTGFGPLIMVGDTKTAFQTLDMAEAFAKAHPKEDRPPHMDAAS